MKWLIVLVSSFVLTHSQDYRFLDILNPHIIHFKDEVQRLNVLPLPKQRAQSQQPIVQENQGTEETLRLPVNMIPQFGPEANVMGHPVKRPSEFLETPLYTNNGNTLIKEVPQTEQRFGAAASGDGNVKQPLAFPQVDKVSMGLTQFGVNLMRIMQKQPGNMVMSPYSIGSLLALLQQGALGTTQLQISNALQMEPSEAADGFKRLTEDLKKRDSNNIFNVANGLFLADGFSINPSFKRVAIKDFGSDVSTVKFTRPSQATAKINNWVAHKTSHKIEKLLEPDSITESMQMMLVNAVYFKGLWQVKFRSQATLPRNFYLPDGSTKSVPFMRMRRHLKSDYDSSINSQVLVLPFEGDQYSLVVILPSQSASVTSAMSSLSTQSLLAYQNIMPKEVALEIPKFTIKTESNLVAVFQELGITNVFGPASDLSGLGNYREFSPQVSSALHSALLSIDEEGGVGAAATSIGVVALSYDDPSVTFVVNRPFLAVLWDKQNSVPLFMAKIEDPKQ